MESKREQLSALFFIAWTHLRLSGSFQRATEGPNPLKETHTLRGSSSNNHVVGITTNGPQLKLPGARTVSLLFFVCHRLAKTCNERRDLPSLPDAVLTWAAGDSKRGERLSTLESKWHLQFQSEHFYTDFNLDYNDNRLKRLISYCWYNPQPMRNNHSIAGTTILETTQDNSLKRLFEKIV